MCAKTTSNISCRTIKKAPPTIPTYIQATTHTTLLTVISTKLYCPAIQLRLHYQDLWQPSISKKHIHTGNTASCWLQFTTYLYTVSHKKRATLFLIITLAFLGRFLYLLHQWKEERIRLYIEVNKIYHFTLSVSPHYLVKLNRHLNSTFWSQSSQCVSIEPVVSNLRRNLSNVLLFQFLLENYFTSLLWENFSHSHKFLTKKN